MDEAQGVPMHRDRAWQLLHEPQTEAAVLAHIATQYPEFAGAIAQHPNCYDALRAWAEVQAVTSSPAWPAPAAVESGSSPRGEPVVESARRGPRWVMLSVIGAVVVVGVVVGAVAVSLWNSQRAVADAREAFTAAVAEYRALASQLDGELVALSGGVGAAEEAGLVGPTIDSAKAAAAAVDESPALEIAGDGWDDPAVVRGSLAELNEAIERIRARLVELEAVRDQLEAETSVALRGTAEAVVATALEEAQHSYDSSAGRVSNEAPRESLRQSIESARASLADTSVSPDQLQQHAGVLAEGVAAVKAAMLPSWDDISGVWCPVDRSWGGCQEIDLSRSYQSGFPPRPGASVTPGPNSGDGVTGCFLGTLWPDDTLSQGSTANLLFCPAGVVSNNFPASVPESVGFDRIYAFQSMEVVPWYRIGDFEAATGLPLP